MSEQTGPLEIRGEMESGFDGILTPEALGFVADLADRFGERIEALLADRRAAQARYDAGERPDFREETRAIREGSWRVAPLPDDLQDRRVEITGPVDRKMIINALNSGAKVFMADIEDSNAPTWHNVIQGQINLRDAVRRTIAFEDAARGKSYTLNEKTAVLMVRPRGWHLQEKHLLHHGKAVAAALVDFGLYFFHNAQALIERGTGPYFYLPKLQSHLEARLWNDIFLHAQESLAIPRGTIKATVLIETLPATFDAEEILYELREHSAGLNCGRWDYIFSYIKVMRSSRHALLPDRSQVTMQQPFMRAYTQHVIKTCHRRGVHAIGGMAAQIPIKNDPAANEAALSKVRADKQREVDDGHDGTWVAHPGLVPLAQEVFDAGMQGPNQLHRMREEFATSQEELCALPTGTRTLAGMRQNINVGIQYLAAWLGGNGCVPLYNLMEDAATAEISRTQLWQWLRHQAILDDGTTVTPRLFHHIVEEELASIERSVGAERFRSAAFVEARTIFENLCLQEQLSEFLTLPAYEHLLSAQAKAA